MISTVGGRKTQSAETDLNIKENWKSIENLPEERAKEQLGSAEMLCFSEAQRSGIVLVLAYGNSYQCREE